MDDASGIEVVSTSSLSDREVDNTFIQFDMKDNINTLRLQIQQNQNPKAILKKCVICIIACHRLNKLLKITK